MPVHEIDPIRDPRWPAFLKRHPEASIFHTPEWLHALQRTYAYQPVVYTTTPPGHPLANGIAFCRIASRLTGKRLVSMPFTDHCQPLVHEPSALSELCCGLQHTSDQMPWKYVELRPLDAASLKLPEVFHISKSSVLHTLNLSSDCGKIFQNFHKSCVQRRIRHAEREHLTYEVGRSEALLAKFYGLQLVMRQKHQLPPQPIAWFRHLIDCLGEHLTIRVASKDAKPVASIITLSYKQTTIYKYGCSDPAHYRLSGIIALLWQAIQAAKQNGAVQFDMGRSECHQTGLLRFKDRWGASRSCLTYYRYPQAAGGMREEGWQMRLGRQVFARMPERLLMATGKLLYKHIG
ncbi:MAG: GNAT family N-acetyltransferase [Candidatus Tectomicrobia bacterium]|nr:GNAT family N-acetyltransferase [Candidatus Tectomicrobia bacterium]